MIAELSLPFGTAFAVGSGYIFTLYRCIPILTLTVSADCWQFAKVNTSPRQPLVTAPRTFQPSYPYYRRHFYLYLVILAVFQHFTRNWRIYQPKRLTSRYINGTVTVHRYGEHHAKESEMTSAMDRLRKNDYARVAHHTLKQCAWDLYIYGSNPVETSKILGYGPDQIRELDAKVQELVASKLLTALDEISAEIDTLIK